MANDEKARIGKIKNLTDALIDLRAKEQDILDEISELAGGGEGMAARLRGFERSWQEVWNARYPGVYAWQYAKDRPNQKRLLKMLAIDDLRERMVRFLRDDDPFLVRNRHSFTLFVNAVNRYAPEHPAPALSNEAEWDRPIGCTCTPPCKTDTEHTRRRMRAAREARA